MRFLHLSDLHFGTEEGDIVQHLNAAIDSIKPDLIVISGDFTQIANAKEFEPGPKLLADVRVKPSDVAGHVIEYIGILCLKNLGKE